MKILKKIGKIILVIIILIIVLVWIDITISTNKEKRNIIRGYNDKYIIEEDGFQCSFSYEEYYYDSSFDEKYKNKENYELVNDKVELLKEHVRESFNTWNKGEYFDVDEVITENDYFYLRDKTTEYSFESSSSIHKNYYVRLYIYDIDNHTLYYIENVT